MKGIFILTLVFFCNCFLYSEQIEYKLKEFSENSDINLEIFNNFDNYNYTSKDSIKKAFIPIKGMYSVYVFIATFEGESKYRGTQIFHDYLILKVDPKTNKVLDGFQYTYEWAEPPPMSDLYRVSEKNIKLENGMRIDKFKMKIYYIEYTSYSRRDLIDDGIIILDESNYKKP